MSKVVDLPPEAPIDVDGEKPGGWWHEAPDGRRVICDLCPRACALAPDARGFCFVRRHRNGRIVSTTYGRSTGFCIDPIEKKPLNHFYPGTSVLSFGTAGCNLGCQFCQNWSSSKASEVDVASVVALPEDIARTAQALHCRSVAFTYNDPIVWAEYAIDTAKACRELGIRTVAVTSGYISALARDTFFRVMDAANVDLKGFTDDFYRKLTSGRLEPVCDTLRWLVHESRVWVEITNLIIPDANDAPEQIEAMCRWIAHELSPDVPLHFTAFHPDFQMMDRGPTPPATLETAYEIARGAGLRYVYTGNVSDRERQSTYCPHCGKLVVERDGYEVGAYAVYHGCCRYCRGEIAGRFDDVPGRWGSRREPVRIMPSRNGAAESSAGERREPPPDITDPPVPQAGAEESKGEAVMVNKPSRPESERNEASDRPQLTSAQEESIFSAAARRVAAAVRTLPARRLDEVLAETGDIAVFGAFVSLKREGRLRSCCGYLGQSVPLHEALDHAAVRAAKEDPRFPPITPGELDSLDMEVWVLWGMQPVEARGRDRIDAVVIGKHGLQIARGAHRGLLLPGVAVEHHLDAEGFLRQVCLKAGLPTDAWESDDTHLAVFEGYAIRGPLGPELMKTPETIGTGGPTPADAGMLAEFCRGNLIALTYGATPSYYLPGGYDGSVGGLIISVRLPGRSETLDCNKIALRAEVPLQATLLEMVTALADVLRSTAIDAGTLQRIRCELTILWDSSSHGPVGSADLKGIDPRRRAVLVAERNNWAVMWDATRPVEELVQEALRFGRFGETSRANVYSLAVASTDSRAAATNVPAPQAGPSVRSAAVAGRFYPGNPDDLNRALDEMIPAQRDPKPWDAVLVPHAGWIYSGRLAARALSRASFPSRVIVICPKHHAVGSDWAVAPHQTWALPGREVQSDPETAALLAAGVPGASLDAEAHRAEHAIEVQLPFIARLAPEARVVGMAIHGGDWERVREAAAGFAQVLRGMSEAPLLVISSDMNHYADDTQTRRLDRLALDALNALDPQRLLEVVRENRISMCGVLPAVFVLETLRQLGRLNRCESVGYATSGETSGDFGHVVGYAAMLFGR